MQARPCKFGQYVGRPHWKWGRSGLAMGLRQFRTNPYWGTGDTQDSPGGLRDQQCADQRRAVMSIQLKLYDAGVRSDP